MKRRQITFWRTSGHEALRGKTVEIFKVSWDDGEWIQDLNGPYWGMYKLGTEEVRRLNREPNDMGNVTYIEEEGVDHLEAEDISVTPEGLDLGEEE